MCDDQSTGTSGPAYRHDFNAYAAQGCNQFCVRFPTFGDAPQFHAHELKPTERECV
jgi:hypothetical protein